MADPDKLKKETQSLLSSLIISSASGLTVNRLHKDYRDEIGEDVPFRKLGFLTFDQFLKSIPETCRLVGSGHNALVMPIVTEKTKHINDMIMKQRPPKTRAKRSRGVCSYSTQPKPVKSQYNLPMIIPPSNPNRNTKLLPPPPDYYNKRWRNSYNLPPRMQKVVENHSANKHTEANCSVAAKSFSGNHRNYFARISYDPPKMPSMQLDTKADEVKSDNSVRCESTREDSNETLNRSYNYAYENDLYDESNDEQNFSGDDFDSDFSYNSDNEDQDLASCSLSQLKITPKENESNLEEYVESRVPDKVKDKLRTLISEHPDGIWCSKLVKLYNERFKQKLEPIEYGFPSVIQLCDDVKDVFHSIRPNRSDWKLFDKRNPLPEINTTKEFSKYLLTLPVETAYCNTEPALPEYPDSVLHPEDKIPCQWLANNEKENDFIQIIVAEVYDPSKFWIQLRGPDIELSSLMDDMQTFYTNNGKSLRLSLLSTRIGLYCAALFMNEYHRAVIIKIYDDETMKVFYIDYGTIAEVQVRQTCFLDYTFAQLPAQAIRARLANIIPKDQNTMWSREATRCMMNLIMEKNLVALISSINSEQKILDLIITDTTLPDVDIHINDVLISEGYAVLGKEAPLCATSSASVSNVHLFPTFYEIENGVYPSISDVVRLLKLGQTYEQIFHGYFVPTPSPLSPTFNYNIAGSSSNRVDAFFSKSECSTTINNNPEYTKYVDTENELINLAKESADINNTIDNMHIDSICENSEDILQTEVPHQVPEKEQDGILRETDFGLVEESSSDLQFPEQQRNESHELGNNNENITKDKLEFREGEKKTNVNIKKPPPGFENVQPMTDAEKNVLMQLFQGSDIHQIPLAVQPASSPTPFDYSSPLQFPYGSNTNLYNGISVHNNYAFNHYLLQRQQEYYQALVQQYSLQENARLAQLQKQTSRPQSTKKYFDKICPPNVSSTLSGLEKHEEPNKQLNYTRDYNSQKCTEYTFEHASSTDPSNLHRGNKYSDNIAFQTGKNCDRYVIKFVINGNIIHILKIDDELYVVSQEVLTNLLKSKMSLKTWLAANELDVNKFPNKLVNIMKYEHVYNQMKSFSIPGVYLPNNLGCNIRLTLLTDVVSIVRKYGDQTTLRDLSTGLQNVRSPELWKSLNSSD